jgi:hypothetical protein
MKVGEIFTRDIHRSINGVVKADQLDASSVWQELDEFVVTRELTTHINDLVSVLLSAIESKEGAAGKNGVWISGFFGSGKSHFIKVLSYLLADDEHTYDGQHRRAVEFFADKLEDAMLFADLQKVVGSATDTILFNIDSKADHQAGRDTLLQVFLKVLNEKQGYSGDHAHIAHMERHLDEKGQLAVFETAFERAAGQTWTDNRDSWHFFRDHVVTALREALGQSEESIQKWVDGSEDNFSLTVENFAKWVKQYLDKKGPDQKLMFLVDEVGQFIGQDTNLMLNLQTITENLGTICNGRAWVVVTSQEDLDAVLGNVTHRAQQDFSKIQGRFKTRLSLSSANVDEVIKERLLRKSEAAIPELAVAYDDKQDILKNALAFDEAGMSFKAYNDKDDFAACYPFAAYQFILVQKVFESIRKAGATGLHLSQGERSILDAFQTAAQRVSDASVGALVPFHYFYSSVEGFLEGAVKRMIDQAGDSHALQPFDSDVLRVLFLIRYIDELPGSVNNLVTLFVDDIDADRLSLRKNIESSLARLESETLVARTGDHYFFLTNEERDIGREIKNSTIPSGDVERELGKLLFDDVLGEMRKHAYSRTGRDFSFNRVCDDHPVGNRVDGDLDVVFTSPLGDQYPSFQDDAQCIMHTSTEQASVLIRLPDDPILGEELRTYLQTEAYVRNRNTATAPDATKKILRDRSDENRTRRGRIHASLKEMLANAQYFASGQKLNITSADPKIALGEALEYVIKNAFPKMDYITHLQSNPSQEIQTTLRANDIDQVNLQIETEEANKKALDEVRTHIQLCASTNKEIVLFDLVRTKFGGRPYGWPEPEVVLLIARLAVLKEINLMVDHAPLPLDRAYDPLTATNRQKKVIVTQRQTADADLLNKAKALAGEIFSLQVRATEDELYQKLKEQFDIWNNDLSRYQPLAEQGQYPGGEEINDCLKNLRRFVEESDSLRLINRFVNEEEQLHELAEDVRELQGFYKTQKSSWEKLREAVTQLGLNSAQLVPHEIAGPALARMQEILGAPRPYNMLHEVADLTHNANQVNEELVAQARAPALAEIQRLLDTGGADLDQVAAAEDLRQVATGKLKGLLEQVKKEGSIAHIAQAQEAAGAGYDFALTAIEKAQAPNLPASSTTPGKPAPSSPTVATLKKRRVVDAKDFWSGGFIETADDMEEFLKKLRAELEAVLAAEERIQIK